MRVRTQMYLTGTCLILKLLLILRIATAIPRVSAKPPMVLFGRLNGLIYREEQEQALTGICLKEKNLTSHGCCPVA